VGLLDKLKAGSRGVMTAADPAPDTSAAPVEEVRRRLHDITGRGIATSEEGGEVIVTWSATVRRSGGGPHAAYDRLYRAVRVELDAEDATAAGICLKATAEADVRHGEISGSKKWERGQHMGSESLRVVAWGGALVTEGAADEEGFKFRWADLRQPVIDAVTGAGWTYRPKRI
jgi:hypothetical protein